MSRVRSTVSGEMENVEGLTYREWLAAAGAITTSGKHASEVLSMHAVYDAGGLRANFSSILRKEWRHGVDPTEWRNYFDDEWATLESWREYKRTSIRASQAAMRLTGEFRVDQPNGVPANLDEKFYVASWFRVNKKQRRTERWWEKR